MRVYKQKKVMTSGFDHDPQLQTRQHRLMCKRSPCIGRRSESSVKMGEKRRNASIGHGLLCVPYALFGVEICPWRVLLRLYTPPKKSSQSACLLHTNDNVIVCTSPSFSLSKRILCHFYYSFPLNSNC